MPFNEFAFLTPKFAKALIERSVDEGESEARTLLARRHEIITAEIKEAMQKPMATFVPSGAVVATLKLVDEADLSGGGTGREIDYGTYLEQWGEKLWCM